MRLLLDTQIYLWFLADSRKLTAGARKRIAAADAVFISAATVWEAAIKVAIGKLHAVVDDVVSGIEASGFAELPVTAAHAARIATLPVHHGDPFDRLLVAQTLHEGLQLVAVDSVLRRYSDLVILV